jgi:3-hydroxymyristoyl/3-hydroxydecanoyl-(acyl carrier protein) dehydratase
MPDFLEMRFAENHPTAAGHFPGNPIIPGALLLDAVFHAIAGDIPPQSSAIRAAKFLLPVRPGDRIRIEWERKRDETHFRCVLAPSGDIAMTGMLRLDDKPE